MTDLGGHESLMGNTKTPTTKMTQQKFDRMYGPDESNIKNQVTKSIVERLQKKK